MTDTQRCQVLVVGGGPGGYVAAIRAGQLGLDTVLVEADRCGGTCLIRGCIPSKALIHAAGRFQQLAAHAESPRMGISIGEPPQLDLAAMIGWKNGIVDQLKRGVEGLLSRAGVRVVQGWARFNSARNCRIEGAGGIQLIRAEQVILATGSQATELPLLPFGGPVISSTEALDPQWLPQRLAIIGAGYIGLELGTFYCKLGCHVTFIEAASRILPLFDTELVHPLEQWLQQQQVVLHLGARADRLEGAHGEYRLHFCDADGVPQQLAVDQVLVTVGRRPNIEGWGLEQMAVSMRGPFVQVDDQCHTSMRGVWAIGDLAGEPMLAHKASFQGEMVAEIIAGQRHRFDPAAIPSICFTEPELIGVGLSPDQARQQGIESVTGRFPLAASGRALATGSADGGGFIRVTARRDNHQLLGIHGVGLHIAELAGEFILALEMGGRLEDLFDTIHAHPTLGETLPEAAMNALGRAIHIVNG